MNLPQMLNELLINMALLVAGVFMLSLTLTARPQSDSPARLLIRYAGAVAVAFLLLLNTVQIAPGLLFDFRSVMVALAARRYGTLVGLLVALPVALYRLSLGAPARGRPCLA
ncbi:hypothetical protein LAJ19_08370 [Deinococcus taeanensis]|uniref:LytS/YhcK type 5TM receptor domain-containing protein n=1 Tax=Deinococcus taeanensis TaxID=2737050 RepID=UPI001CDD4D2F|nr:LytS/YhcK type 5TM receptor domain-containing protein [Deinococcus taeanensis]UBV41669.1 hypothetical protein LAJ19_08370 [Deinococcus taeanensis]